MIFPIFVVYNIVFSEYFFVDIFLFNLEIWIALFGQRNVICYDIEWGFKSNLIKFSNFYLFCELSFNNILFGKAFTIFDDKFCRILLFELRIPVFV